MTKVKRVIRPMSNAEKAHLATRFHWHGEGGDFRGREALDADFLAFMADGRVEDISIDKMMFSIHATISVDQMSNHNFTLYQTDDNRVLFERMDVPSMYQDENFNEDFRQLRTCSGKRRLRMSWSNNLEVGSGQVELDLRPNSQLTLEQETSEYVKQSGKPPERVYIASPAALDNLAEIIRRIVHRLDGIITKHRILMPIESVDLDAYERLPECFLVRGTIAEVLANFWKLDPNDDALFDETIVLDKPPPEPKAMSKRRGAEGIDEAVGTWGTILIQGDAAAISKDFVKAGLAKVELANAWKKREEIDASEDLAAALIQLKGHGWTFALPNFECEMELAAKWAAKLKLPLLLVGHEKMSGGDYFTYYEQGVLKAERSIDPSHDEPGAFEAALNRLLLDHAAYFCPLSISEDGEGLELEHPANVEFSNKTVKRLDWLRLNA